MEDKKSLSEYGTVPREIDRIRDHLKWYPDLDIYVMANNFGEHYWDTINTYIDYKKEPIFITKETSYLGRDYNNAYVLLCQNWYENPIAEKESFRHFLREAKFKIPLGETPLIRTAEVSRKLKEHSNEYTRYVAGADSGYPSLTEFKGGERILHREEGSELILPDNMYFYIRDKILEEKAQELQKELKSAIDNALDYYNEGIKEGNILSKERYDTLVKIKQKIGQSTDDFLGINLDELNEIGEAKYRSIKEFITEIMYLSSYHVKEEG